jgi:hypothetical protein
VIAGAVWLLACAALVLVLHLRDKARQRTQAWICPSCGHIAIRPTRQGTLAHLQACAR